MTSSPAGIDCGVTCTANFPPGTVVSLAATPDPGSTFAGWTGDPDCTDGSIICNATFAPAPDADIDGDGVSNTSDVCGLTRPGDPVDPATGCSIAQLCPCEAPRGMTVPWRNHGQYVSCVANSAESFVEQELITEAQKDVIVSGAAGSVCGRKH